MLSFVFYRDAVIMDYRNDAVAEVRKLSALARVDGVGKEVVVSLPSSIGSSATGKRALRVDHEDHTEGAVRALAAVCVSRLSSLDSELPGLVVGSVKVGDETRVETTSESLAGSCKGGLGNGVVGLEELEDDLVTDSGTDEGRRVAEDLVAANFNRVGLGGSCSFGRIGVGSCSGSGRRAWSSGGASSDIASDDGSGCVSRDRGDSGGKCGNDSNGELHYVDVIETETEEIFSVNARETGEIMLSKRMNRR